MNIFKWLICSFTVLFASSCATVHYANPINSTFIEAKGDTRLGGGASFTSINLQASHALSDHIRIAGDVNYWGWNASIGDQSEGAQGLQSSVMAGYYKKINSTVYLECYGGVGVGILEDDFLSKAIFQPSIGFGKDRPRFSISSRGVYLTNTLFGTPEMLHPEDETEIVGIFIDTAFSHRFYRERFDWFIQYGFSHDNEKFGDNRVLPFTNVGINWRL